MVALDRLARSAQSTTQTGLWTAEGYRRFNPKPTFEAEVASVPARRSAHPPASRLAWVTAPLTMGFDKPR